MNEMKDIKNKVLFTREKLFDILVIGEINVDLILSGNVDPQFGQVEKIVNNANLVIGSSAVIFACGVARLGLKTAFIGVVGADMFGRFMIESMNQKGVDTSAVVVDPKIQTGLSVILSRDTDRAILTYPGSIPELKYSHIDFSLFEKSKHLHLSSFFLLDKLRPDISRIFRKARQSGLSISIDTNYDPAEKWNGGVQDAIKYADIILPNETEIKAITGEKSIDEAMSVLSEKVSLVAVKQGELGAAAKRRGDISIGQESIPVSVVDTVGAGDSFDAGFVYAFLNAWSLEDTLKMAVVCGSLSTRKAGGTSAQPDLAEAMYFMNR